MRLGRRGLPARGGLRLRAIVNVDSDRPSSGLCDLLRPKLLADGLYFVSVDIAGDKILELNVFARANPLAARDLPHRRRRGDHPRLGASGAPQGSVSRHPRSEAAGVV